jgi:hypothetical protein
MEFLWVVLQTWIVGKWTWAKEQQYAPPGTFFHQFVVPVIQEVRKDCTYGQLAGMVLPSMDVKGLRTCEVYNDGEPALCCCCCCCCVIHFELLVEYILRA